MTLPHVTNHAVERYLERAKGFDPATVAEAMRSANRRTA